MKRLNTKYPGVYYIVGKSISNDQQEKIYYINYRRSGKRIEEKAGRQFSDNMTSAKANSIRSMRIEGKQLSNVERRKKESELKLDRNVWTLAKLWNEYHYQKSAEGTKSLEIDTYRYNKYLSGTFGYKEPRDITISDVDDLRLNISKTLFSDRGVTGIRARRGLQSSGAVLRADILESAGFDGGVRCSRRHQTSRSNPHRQSQDSILPGVVERNVRKSPGGPAK